MFAWRYLRVYVIIIVAALAVAAIQMTAKPPLIVDLALVGLSSFVVVVANRHLLKVHETFPEVLRLPFMRRLLGAWCAQALRVTASAMHCTT